MILKTSAPHAHPVPSEPRFYPEAVRGLELLTPDRDRLGRFYADLLGWVELRREPGVSVWGQPPGSARPGSALTLTLVEDSRAQPRPRGTVGLFHAAFLLPDRPALAAAARRLLVWAATDPGVAYHGYSEHGVSEAVYGCDPDGNGVELTCDHPFIRWPRDPHGPAGDRLAVFTRPLNLSDLLALDDARPPNGGVAPARFGHVHLQVSDLPATERFFAGELGMSVVQRSYAGALFLAYGDYHHHVAANVWAGRGAAAPAPGTAGLLGFTLRTPAGRTVNVPTSRLADR